ncbi:RNA polymerase sigma factor (sigma-70 family) [Chitinophaga dinghuensis]|uniref:RNA polymerase sigma factor (Sigma-70 family) n=1 Tax=Chitinophaga dinghuensis TaxID=1539050 RepID=A0A327VV15_9BACT|nr:RNA polymerase sigma factor [Chitinophaga dinghuensis]RAJ79090.1 RNA polymerase sigma factor (sigma-70 family) [Chitinophaga dinghuensis]
MYAITDDTLLWEAVVSGDERAFEEVYQSAFPTLYEYGMRFIRDEAFVEESIQQLFVKVWTNKATLTNVRRIRPYLLFSLRTLIYNKIRDAKRKRISELDADYDFELEFSPESLLIRKETDAERLRSLQAALDQLTPRQKEIIFLRYYQGLDYKDITEIMDISLKGAYKLTARSLDTLRGILGLSVVAVILLLKTHAAK